MLAMWGSGDNLVASHGDSDSIKMGLIDRHAHRVLRNLFSARFPRSSAITTFFATADDVPQRRLPSLTGTILDSYDRRIWVTQDAGIEAV